MGDIGFGLSAEEVNAWDQIGEMLDRFPDLLDSARRFEPLVSASGSSLASDDAELGEYPASQLVATCLASGVDCLGALDTLMVEEDGGLRLYIFAQYPLLRAVLEASAQALWLLGPDGQTERITRNLRLRATEFKHDAALFEPFIGKKKTLPHALAPYKNKQVDYATVVQQGIAGALDDDAGAHALSVWRMVSGFTHAYTRRFTMFSTRIPFDAVEDYRQPLSGAEQNAGADESPADGPAVSITAPNAQIVWAALQTAVIAFETMLQLVEERSADS